MSLNKYNRFIYSAFIFALTTISPAQASPQKLTVVAPTPEKYFKPYLDLFEDWYLRRNGEPIEATQVLKGGVEISPYIEERAGSPQGDVVASIAFKEIDWLAQNDFLESYVSDNAQSIPRKVMGNLEAKDDEGRYTAVSLSAYGIMLNEEILNEQNLQIPTGYGDLAMNTGYAGKIVMGSPLISRISRGSIELFLAHYGWQEGWSTVLRLVSLIDHFENSTGTATEKVAEGDYAAVLTKHSYLNEYLRRGYPVKWVWPSEGTYVYLLYTGILKGTKNRKNAEEWVDWMLSSEGQAAWADLRNETVIRSDITLPTGVQSMPELYSQARIEPNYSEESLMLHHEAVSEMVLRIIGYLPALQESIDRPHEFEVFIDTWIKRPVEEASISIDKAESEIAAVEPGKLCNQGLLHISQAKILLKEAQDAFEEKEAFREARDLAADAIKELHIAKNYPAPPAKWPYYVFITFLVFSLLTLSFLLFRKRALEEERKRLERTVQERTAELLSSEQRFRGLVENTPDIIWEADSSFRFNYMSPQVQKILGYKPTDLMGTLVTDSISNDESSCSRQQLVSIMQKGDNFHCYEIALARKDNSIGFFEIGGVALMTKEGITSGYQGIIRDVTDRKEYEKSIRQTNQLMLTVLEGVSAGIMVIDVSTYEVLYANEFIKNMYGNQMIGKKCYSYFGEQENGPCKKCNNLQIAGTGVKEERKQHTYQFFDKNNGGRWFLIKVRAVEWIDGRVARLQVMTDITRMKETEQLREDIERITRHDLRGSLNSIINVPIIISEDGNINEEQRELLKAVEKSGRKMLTIIENSLNLYKMELGTYQLVPTQFNLMHTLNLVLENLQSIIKEKELHVKIKIETSYENDGNDGEALLVYAEESLCYAVFQNLLVNACEASPQGGTVNIAFSKETDIVIAIHNLGAVPKEIRKTFFEKYSTYGKIKGTGLGTYSAKLMVETQGGGIHMETDEVLGTTVIVNLPVAAITAE